MVQKGALRSYPVSRELSVQFDLFEKDMIIFPINMGNLHWTAAAINLKLKRFEYYDSLGDGGAFRNGVFSVRIFVERLRGC